MAKRQRPNIMEQLSPRRIIWPVVIGLAVVIWLFVRDFDSEAFRAVNWTMASVLFLALSAIAMLLRDWAYVYRLRLLTDGKLGWMQCLQVILLWEFGSAATPTSVGGTTLAIYLLAKEGLTPGRSTAIIMFSVLLDEVFFILAIPVLLIVYGQAAIYPGVTPVSDIGGTHLLKGLLLWFALTYTLIFGYTLILAYGLFVNPQGMKKLLYRIFSLPFLMRWRKGAVRAGSDIIIASHEIRNRSPFYWIKAFLATSVSWLGRFLVANFLLLVFTRGVDHMLVLARQLVMFVIMTVSPTPGGSGVAELSFTTFLADFIPRGMEGSMVLFWRMVSYYIYLFIGVVLLPRWLKKVLTGKTPEPAR